VRLRRGLGADWVVAESIHDLKKSPIILLR
jgi:hypothetical protein